VRPPEFQSLSMVATIPRNLNGEKGTSPKKNEDLAIVDEGRGGRRRKEKVERIAAVPKYPES